MEPGSKELYRLTAQVRHFWNIRQIKYEGEKIPLMQILNKKKANITIKKISRIDLHYLPT